MLDGPIRIRTNNSIYEIDPGNNRYRKVGGDWLHCLGDRLLQPIVGSLYWIWRGDDLDVHTSTVREIL